MTQISTCYTPNCANVLNLMLEKDEYFENKMLVYMFNIKHVIARLLNCR